MIARFPFTPAQTDWDALAWGWFHLPANFPKIQAKAMLPRPADESGLWYDERTEYGGLTTRLWPWSDVLDDLDKANLLVLAKGRES